MNSLHRKNLGQTHTHTHTHTHRHTHRHMVRFHEDAYWPNLMSLFTAGSEHY